jgi:hypothetical protein
MSTKKRNNAAAHTPNLKRINTRHLAQLVESGDMLMTEQARHDYGATFTMEDVQAVLYERQDKAQAAIVARQEREHALAHCKACGTLKTPHNTGMQGKALRATCRPCTALQRRQEREERKTIAALPF